MIYLDWASTAPPDTDILASASEAAANFFGNPSSAHALGARARSEFEDCRARVLRSLGSPGGRLVLTSGGSEADAIALLAVLRNRDRLAKAGLAKRLHLVTTEIEHAAVYEEARLLGSLGLAISFVRPGADGIVDPARVAAAVTRETALVAVMAVNNETGAIQPLAEIARSVGRAARDLGTPLPRIHADAVQAFGKIEFRPGDLGISSAAFSAHKLQGPRGAGALWAASPLDPLVVGGGQEGGLRPGTENLQGAWAFARVAESAVDALSEHRAAARALEARLLSGLASIPGAVPLPLGRSAGDPRYSPFILSVAFPGLSGEVLARALSDVGVAVSTGSACSTNSRHKGRRVLDAMGLDADLSFSAIRVSWGYTSAPSDIDAFLEAGADLYRKLKP